MEGMKGGGVLGDREGNTQMVGGVTQIVGGCTDGGGLHRWWGGYTGYTEAPRGEGEDVKKGLFLAMFACREIVHMLFSQMHTTHSTKAHFTTTGCA